MNIAVLSLNPGVDRYIFLEGKLSPGKMNRSTKCVVTQGSKGANQALVLSYLGVEPRYYSFAGGTVGEESKRFLRGSGIKDIYAETSCDTRLNIKVMDSEGCCTELNERGGPYTAEELSKLIGMLEGDADKFDILSIAGSIPRGLGTDTYRNIIAAFKKRGKTVVLDCDGAALASGLEACPDVIKPNIHELSAYLCRELAEDEEIKAACAEIYGRFGTDVICTMGPRGAIYSGRGGTLRITTPDVKVRGFSGAGDTFLAAYTYSAYGRGDSAEVALRFADDAATAKVQLEGTTLPKEFLSQFIKK